MDGTSGHDFKKVRKVLLIALVVYALFNHAVRAFSGGGAAAAPGGFNFTGNIAPSIFGSLDGFRRRTGDGVKRLDRFCPESAQGMCDSGLYGLRQVLGL